MTKGTAFPKVKVHPWRMCPSGEHWVVTHPLHIPPSTKNPAGSVTTRHEHCARNPSGKDQLYADEIQEIDKRHFSDLKNKPCPLTLGFKNGAEFDDIIAGWTQYWNEVLNPDQFLDPSLVKALIASESSFDPMILANKKDSNSARGLMQITNDTRKILADERGELKDHYVTVTKKELNDPNLNICAGIRWLFQKRLLAAARLGRAATWVEAAEEYKGDLGGLLKKNEKSKKDVSPFLDHLEKLQKCSD